MKRRRKILVGVLVGLLVIAGLVYLNQDWIRRQFFKPTSSSIEEGVNTQNLNPADAEPVKVIANNLTVPWGVAFLPNGQILVTERSGTLRRIDDGQTYAINGVLHRGEGGLLGLALHPDFAQNHWLYLYLTTSQDGTVTNRVERYTYTDNQLSAKTTILDNIPGSPVHDGGRIAFGPDKHLYITTGDAGQPNLAQNKDSLAGKILRLTDTGTATPDNPFGNMTYSYGHRNPQGLAWDEDGQLWSTEHGPSGTETGYDELNLIKKGANYGWPNIRGDATAPGMESPIVQSGSAETWAPGGLAYLNGSLFFGGLRGETLYEAKIQNGNNVTMKAHFRSEYGRIRTTIVTPDGFLYMTTSNTDGRGEERPEDDNLVRFSSSVFGL